MAPDPPALGAAAFVASLCRRAILRPLGIAAAAAALAFVGHASTSSTPWFLLLSFAWTFGGVAWLVLALGAAVYRPMRSRLLRSALLGYAAFCLLLLPAYFLGNAVLRWRVERWKERGAAIAAAVEDHRARTGAFPQSLDEVPGAPRLAGTLRYQSDGSGFELVVYNPTSALGWDGWHWNRESRSWEYHWS